MTPFEPTGFAKRLTKTEQLLATGVARYNNIVFANSLGAEDVVLTDLIWRNHPQIGVFTLDTGRLNPETYKLMARLEQRYARRMAVYFPRSEAVTSLVSDQGINGFYDNIENRKSCCFVRKIEPLKRALSGRDAWVTGLRRQQSATRVEVPAIGPDPAFGLDKINPLIEWSSEDVWHYIRANQVPYNELHDQGFPSIGCAPCSRAIAPGEDERSGRWWWEQAETRECGLHRQKEVA